MCGITGFITTKAEHNADDFIKDSFMAGSVRGTDSAGILYVDTKKGEYELHKLPVNGTMFTTDNVAARLARKVSSPNSLAICHTRAATQGSVSINTAHPFECYTDDEAYFLVGVHNGTLQNWKSKKGANAYEVDSEWALNHILREGDKAFEDFTGAYTFVWWEGDNPDSLFIARNKERPMHVCFLENGGMAYASEAGMLYWLLERRGIKMDGPIIALEVGQKYEFPLGNPKEFTKTELPEAKYVTYTNPSYSTRTPYRSTFDKVKELLSPFKLLPPPDASTYDETAPLVGRVPKSVLVSPDEYSDADALGILGARVEFGPASDYGDVIEGTAVVLDSEVDAEVRGMETSVLGGWELGDVWYCNVLGVKDDQHNTIVAVLGPPIMKERAKPANVSAVH